MTSFTHEIRARPSDQRRDSLSRSLTRQRPVLLRSSATEPSITASNATRSSLVSGTSPKTATDILSSIPVCSPSVVDDAGSPSSTSDFLGTVATPAMDFASPQPLDHDIQASQSCNYSTSESSDCYFSFPNFDEWSDLQQADGKDSLD